MTTRKLTALILSILMIVTMLPTNIFAAPSAVTAGDTAEEIHVHEEHEHEDEHIEETAELSAAAIKPNDHIGDNFYLNMIFVQCKECRNYLYSSSDGTHSLWLESAKFDYKTTPGQFTATFVFGFTDCAKVTTYTPENTQTFSYNCTEKFLETFTGVISSSRTYCYMQILRNPTDHAGSDATCMTPANCYFCNAECIGDHIYSSEYTQVVSGSTYKHRRMCTYDCGNYVDEANCSGGTATCKDKAVCTVCKNSYGTISSTHSGDTDGDHICNLCEREISECVDEDKNHICDICKITLSECADADNDHYCDHCQKTLSECADADNDHYCDICETELSECNYINGFCVVCGYEPAVLNNGVYEISNAGQLYWFAAVVNTGYGDVAQNTSANAVLADNIIVNPGTFDDDGNYIPVNGETVRNWTPIGGRNYQYIGTFDGNGKTIHGLFCPSGSYLGLFGYLGSGTIKNVGVVDSYFSGYQYVAGIAGWNTGGTITDCHNTDTFVNASKEYAGGITGYNNSGLITKCYNAGTITAYQDVGGIVGYNQKGRITDCYNTGTIDGNRGGGILGYNVANSKVENCFSTGSIIKHDYIGGIIGTNSGGTLNNSYYLDTCGASRNGISKTAEQFASGEVAYLLQGNRETEVWGQDLSDENSLPALDGEKVYFGYENCGDAGTIYSNTELYETLPEHEDEKNDYTDNGDGTHSYICTVCGVVTENHSIPSDSNTCACGVEVGFTGIEVTSDFALIDNGNGNYIAVIEPGKTGAAITYKYVVKNPEFITEDNTILKTRSNSNLMGETEDSVGIMIYSNFIVEVEDWEDGFWWEEGYSNDGGNTWEGVHVDVKQGYAITVNTPENGTVTAKEYAIAGEIVSLDVSPAENYVLIELTVTDADGNDIPVENNSFTMPASAVSITAIFKKPTVAQVTSADGTISEHSTIEEAIAKASENEASTIKLLDNITATSPCEIYSGKFTIDLNGKTWESTELIICAYNNTQIKICDSSENADGLITTGYESAIRLWDESKLEIESGNFSCSGNYVVDMANIGKETSSELLISGGKFVCNGVAKVAGRKATLTGGEFECAWGYPFDYLYGTLDLSNYKGTSEMGFYVVGHIDASALELIIPEGAIIREFYSGEIVTELTAGNEYRIEFPEISYIEIDLGARSADTNIRYAEIAGVVSEIEENGDKYICQIGEENLLIEFVEKTAGGEVVRTQYFFVDMEAMTAEKLSMDSYMTADDSTSIRINNPMGMRFKSNVLTSAKNEEAEYVIDEYGFVVATEDALGETELTLDFSKYVTGVAYNREDGTDIVFDRSDDEVHVFTGYVKNIPVAQYKTNLVCKTYTKITVDGEQFVVYGEAVTGNIYDTATALLEDDTLDTETREKLTQIILDYENTIGLPGDELYPES